MILLQRLFQARSHITFLCGISAAAGFALWVDHDIVLGSDTATALTITRSADQKAPATPRALTPAEQEAAHIAWDYFENNVQPETGLANATHNYPSTTLWDQASYMLGVISAADLGLIPASDAQIRLQSVLASLAHAPLFDGVLPNKAYHTRSLAMVDYTNMPVPRGIGWSALDVSRMLVPLAAIERRYPALHPELRTLLSRWHLHHMTEEGFLMGARVNPETGATERVQEGRLGYEEYAARAATLFGQDTLEALRYEDQLAFVKIAEHDIALDTRSLRQNGTSNFIVSEPYLLTAFEFGLDTKSRELAWRLFSAQKQRHQSTGIPTAISEDHINQAPYFLYYSAYGAGQRWVPLSEAGEPHPDLATVSTKAALGWDMLYDDPYTALLRDVVAATAIPGTGWYAGVYESDGALNDVATANTNGIILEALAFRLRGPLLQN